MARELAYALINPYSIAKSRTGGIIARFLSRTGLALVGARMYGPNRELVEAYAQKIRDDATKDHYIRGMLADYVHRAYGPDPETGRVRRVMMLLFEGEDAIQKVRDVAGPIRPNMEAGETVRDTFGDFILGPGGQVHYIEPAVLVAPDKDAGIRTMQLWSRYAESDGGLISAARELPPDTPVERTLVLIKPDNFRFPSSRPGNIIDLFSRSGLRIIGAKVHRMSCAEACEFYKPVREILHTRLAKSVGERARQALARELGMVIPEETAEQLGGMLGPMYGEQQFKQIIHFMTGCWIDECQQELMDLPGEQRCLALVYAGVNAVDIIRNILGPTDPEQATPGTVRKELGQDIMINAAHASDSADNARREMKIIKVEENQISPIVEKYYPAT